MKKIGANKNFEPPLSEKTGARKEKRQKWPSLGLKRAKYDRKMSYSNFSLLFH